MVWLALVILAVILAGVITRKREPVYDPIIGEALLAAMDKIEGLDAELKALRERAEVTRTAVMLEKMARLKSEAPEPLIVIRQGRPDPDEKPN